ncbi:hypothetical protein Vadar_034133 [Vaccinium darrowii]|uniref:Uncharacterized protein n=1 Tax=Vaccinium darrowii TaxID=229202 RepID=A0ACB7YIB2_9ERIC|nr:hypothetical protein Vadar_034133 [Vaccinium darrowii]
METMKSMIPTVSTLIIFALSLAPLPCFAGDFLYLVLQWPGSYCSAKHGCCFPKNGKPANDFTIAGLWPCYLNATIPQFCNSHSHLNLAKASNLTKSLQVNWASLACPSNDGSNLWAHEWQQHGTCSGLNQVDYFESALRLKKQVNLLKTLNNAGIQPNGRFYETGAAVEETIRKAVGYMPGVWCNNDKSGNRQLYQVVVCGDVVGNRIIDCPGIPMGKGECAASIKFPPF